MRPLLRIWHPWQAWECHRAGFFGPFPEGMNKAKGEEAYATFFRTSGLFEASLKRVLEEWPRACEHNLSNPSLNKIAWGGQAAACIALGIPAECRAGFNKLTAEEQDEANATSERVLRTWYERNGYEQPKKL